MLESIQPYKLRPSPDSLPGRWMTGTQNHECIAGAAAAVDYLAAIGRQIDAGAASRRAQLERAFAAITVHERALGSRLLAGLAELPGVRVWGIAAPDRLTERVPTVSFTHDRLSPREIAVMAPLVLLIFWIGLYPKPFLARIEPTAQAYLERVEAKINSSRVAAVDAERREP